MSTVLVTGGTGKTGRRLAARLRSAGHTARIATRSPGAADTVAFDWADKSTYAPALEGADAVYLVAPGGVVDMLGAMQPFLDLAMREPSRRFVLLSALGIPRGSPLMGAVHDYLASNAGHWTVLRPSWFLQNFSEGLHRKSIREHGIIRTAAGEGRTGFVDADDIAAVAAAAFTRDMPNGEKIPTGPQALSYGDAAAIIAQAIGRPVRHESVSEAALVDDYEALGIARDYARALASLNAGIARGVEDRTSDDVADAAGRPPLSLAAFAEREKAAWA